MASEFKNIDPDEFERLVANVWDGLGWNTTVTSSARDDGIDVEATRWTEDGKEKHLIQAKRYDSKVSAPEIREYAGLYQQESDVDKVIVVSTGGFTDPAKEVASKTDIELIDGHELKRKYRLSDRRVTENSLFQEFESEDVLALLKLTKELLLHIFKTNNQELKEEYRKMDNSDRIPQSGFGRKLIDFIIDSTYYVKIFSKFAILGLFFMFVAPLGIGLTDIVIGLKESTATTLSRLAIWSGPVLFLAGIVVIIRSSPPSDKS